MNARRIQFVAGIVGLVCPRRGGVLIPPLLTHLIAVSRHVRLLALRRFTDLRLACRVRGAHGHWTGCGSADAAATAKIALKAPSLPKELEPTSGFEPETFACQVGARRVR